MLGAKDFFRHGVDAFCREQFFMWLSRDSLVLSSNSTVLSCEIISIQAARNSLASWADIKKLSYGSNYTLGGGGESLKCKCAIIYELLEVMALIQFILNLLHAFPNSLGNFGS